MLEFLGWLFGIKPKDKKKKKRSHCVFEGCTKVCECDGDCVDNKDSQGGLCIVYHTDEEPSGDRDTTGESSVL